MRSYQNFFEKACVQGQQKKSWKQKLIGEKVLVFCTGETVFP